MNKSSGLGRGLGSLIPMRQNTSASMSAPATNGLRQVPLASIVPNPRQPRRHFSPSELEDLIASIKEHGVMQPLVVTELSDGRFELIAGERRLRASTMLGLATVPVVIRTANDQQKLELALIENIQRQDLNALEEAVGYQALINEFHLTQDEVAHRVGKSRSVVANTLRLLDLSAEMQSALVENKISKSHARTLLSETDPAKREHLFHAMLTGAGLTVREAEVQASGVKKTGSVKPKDPNVLDHERRLREILGTKVEIADHAGKGKIILHYYSKDELRELLSRLAD